MSLTSGQGASTVPAVENLSKTSLSPTEGDAIVAIEDATAAKSSENADPRSGVAEHGSPATDTGTKSIYDFWSPKRRAITLAVVCISQFLNPISQNIILPGLKVRYRQPNAVKPSQTFKPASGVVVEP
jgi:hypothetical protein